MDQEPRLKSPDNEVQQHAIWAAIVVRSYWFVIVLHAVVQMLSFSFLPYERTAADFLLNVLTFPTLAMVASVLLTELVAVFRRQLLQPALFLTGTVIACSITYVNADIRIIAATFLMPIFSSIIFYRVRVTLYVCMLQLVAFFALYAASAGFRGYFTLFDIIAIPCFFAGGGAVSAIIIRRAQHIMEHLQHTMLAKQELMVQNIVMDRRSKTDALTGLYNHISFHDYLEGAIRFASNGGALHVAMLDIDNFKTVNDRYGHRTGDQVLEDVAEAIRVNLNGNDLGARYGGEEFALLLFEHSTEDAWQLVETIRRQICAAEKSMPGGDRLTVSVSIGLKRYEHGMSKEALFEAADALLYQAKHNGKNRTEFA